MSDNLDAARRVSAVIQSSVLVGVVDRALRHVWRAAADSVTASTATQAASWWTGFDAGGRRLVVGATLLAAVVAHIGFTLVTRVPPGWLWLIVPGMAGAIGLLLVAASRRPRLAGR